MAFPASVRAVVTGAGSGLGRAFCQELVAAGAQVLAADVDLPAAEETCALLHSPLAHPVRADVRRPDEVAGLVELAREKLGGASLLVNNAGVGRGGLVGEVSLADWREVLEVNLLGVVHGCHAFVPYFRQRGEGHLLNVASAAGLVGGYKMGPYNASKAAVVALSETLHQELLGTELGVTVLCPWFFPTNIARHAPPEEKATVEALMQRSPLSAVDVARRGLADARAGKLYSLPHAEARWAWLAKRLAPERFGSLALATMRRMKLA